MFRTLYTVSIAATLILSPGTLIAQSAPCTHDLSSHPDALFCRAYDNGSVLFRTSMQDPTTIWDWSGSIEVVIFDNYMVVLAGGNEFIVPRERMVYAGSRDITGN